jgi:hypothetical protein
MLLRSPAVVEKRPPRLWSLGVAAGLLSLAALVAGAGLRADPARADEPARQKEEPKKEEPKKDEGAKKEAPKKEADNESPEIDNIIKNLPPGLDAEHVKMLRENMKRMMEQMRKQGVEAPFPGAVAPFGGFAGEGQGAFNPFGRPAEGRLGVRVQQPSEALVDQLDLPKGQGVVIEDVTPDSAAAKAGLKANDILLELNGKAVSSNVAECVKMINGLKAKTPLDAVVMRKGKKETIKGISLPEAKAEAPRFGGFGGAGGAFGGVMPAPGVPGAGAFGGAGGAGGFIGGLPGAPGFVGGANGVMTTVFRSGDHFTARHQEGSLVISVTGNVADGKATTKTITVQDGLTHEKYESLDKVPEQYRDKVKNLVEMGEKGAAKVEIK